MRAILRNGTVAIGILLGLGSTAYGGVLGIAPVTASGPHVLIGDEIRLTGTDQIVTLEVKLSDWAPHTLRLFEVRLDDASYANGVGDPLFPATVPCMNAGQCTGPPNNFGPGTFCSGGNCIAGWQDRARATWAFLESEPDVVPGVGTSTPQYNYFAVVAGEIYPTDDGTRKYGGTLLLEVPPGARGTYEIKFFEDPEISLMGDENNQPHPEHIYTRARIVITCAGPADCNDNNACTTDTCSSGVCANTPNYNTATQCCNPANGNLTIISDGNDCTTDSCNTGTGQVTHTNVPNLTPCGDPTNTQCNRPDSCNATGTCLPRFEPTTTSCNDPTNTTCNPADTCDGAGSCVIRIASAGTPCGSSSNTDCDDPDTCNGLGACLANQSPDNTPCSDGLFCTDNERCTSGMCGGGTPHNCADLLTCTTDICDEANDECDHNLDPDRCLIDGVCYLADALNPTNTCEECSPGDSTSDWTVLSDGTLCNDGNACTGTGNPDVDPDTCTGGVCAGELDPNCNDTCDVAVEAIVGQNFSDNSSTGPDDGDASCQVDSNNDVWFAYTALCDGAVFVSTTGSALAPVNDAVLSVFDDCPLLGGVEIACDDDSGAGLNAALIFPTTGGATYLIRVAGFEQNVGPIVLNLTPVDDCLIDGVCYAEGDLNPANDCQACIPQLSTTQWSSRAEGSACGNNADTDCDSPDACDGAGVCEVNYKTDGIQCTDEGPPHNECTQNLCLAGLCTHPPEPAGLGCDFPGEGVDDCDNPDTCNGGGLCAENLEPAGFPCGNPVPTDPDCDNPDICDGLGVCLGNPQPNGTACDDEDVCTGTDICTNAVCAGTSILQAPQVISNDPRHLIITPQPPGSPAPIALFVTSPDFPCLMDWVNDAGHLVDISNRVFHLTDDWGSRLISDLDVYPDTDYEVRAVCGTFMSAPGTATTKKWGDVNGDGLTNVVDILIVVDAVKALAIPVPLYAVDLYPCLPDGLYNALDISKVVDAVKGYAYTCSPPCHP
jgi:hypothetical protein